MPTYTTTIEIEVEVEYTHHAAWRGIRERGGMQLEPDEPEGVTIDSARIVGGPVIDTDLLGNLDDLEGEILACEREAREYAAECAAEDYMERRRERLYAEGSL